MSLFTSTQFASAAASGTDWRDTAKNVLEKLESVRTQKDSFNLGFLYISDYLAEDATSILNLFKSVLGIENWVGSIGMGVVGCGESFMDQPAIAALVGKFPEDGFCVFPKTDEFKGSDFQRDPQEDVKDWLKEHSPMLTIVHGDPMAQQDPTSVLEGLERNANAFVVGGMTSSRSHHYQIANNICENTVSGVFFKDNIPVSTMLSQGCAPISDVHTVTRTDDMRIVDLDNRRAIEVFQEDLKALASEKLGRVVGEFKTDLKSLSSSEQIPEEYMPLFKGQIHAALPLSLSDQKDFTVRDITALSAEDGTMAIAHPVSTGDRILFVQRNTETLTLDLKRSLTQLRERVEVQQKMFMPKGGLYFSCIARGFTHAQEKFDEMKIVQEIIGNIPLAGFYAGGEISNARLYGYTGILVLFL